MDRSIEPIKSSDQRRHFVASWIKDAVKPVDSLISEQNSSKSNKFEVREYQLDAWASLWQARQDGARSGLVHLATGLGKTSVAVFDVMKFREEFTAATGTQPKILFACHQNDILEQAQERFHNYVPDASHGFFNGESKDLSADLTFATLQSLRGSLTDIGSDYFDYIIYDEAHHSKAETFEEVVNHFKPKFQLALTATPNRMDDLDIREHFGNELYSKSLAEALVEGWLADVDYHIVFDEAVKEAMQSGFEADTLRALAGLFDVKPRNEVIAKNIREEINKIGLEFGSVKTIIFCQNIEHAQEMAKLLNGKPYHSGITKEVRKNTLAEFKSGELQVICTRDMFNEGVDIPDARLLVFLRSTSSQTVFEQQLGRGLRKQEGKDRVSVLDFVANIERIAMIQELVRRVADIAEDRMNQNIDIEDAKQEPDNTEGFQVHTPHGDFDFAKLTIDLLNKWNALTEAAIVPEGWLSVSEISRILGLSRSVVMRLAAEIGSNGTLLYGGLDKKTNIGRYFTPDEFEQIKSKIEKLEPAEEGFYTVDSLCKQLNVNQGLIRTVVKQLGIEGTRMRSKHNFTAFHYSDEEKQAIEKHIEIFHQKTDGWKTANAISEALNISPQLVKGIIQAMNIDGELMKPHRGPISMHYSRETQELIRDEYSKIPNVPLGWISVTTLSKIIGGLRGGSMNAKVIHRIAEELNIAGETYRASNGKPGLFYSPSDIEKILSRLGHSMSEIIVE